MNPTHKRLISLPIPMKTPLISLAETQSDRIRAWFAIPALFSSELLPRRLPQQVSCETDFRTFFRRKLRNSQKFYQDSSFELCENLEKLLKQQLKPLNLANSFVNLLRDHGRSSLLSQEISSQLLSSSFELKLRIFLLKIRAFEEERLLLAWVSWNFPGRQTENLRETLLFLKETLLSDSREKFQRFLEFLTKGLALSFRIEILEILAKNPPHRLFIEKFESFTQENQLIELIRTLKFDAHCEFSMFTELLNSAKRQEINVFAMKLLCEINADFLGETSSFYQEIRKFLKEYDLEKFEEFLEEILKIMKRFLGETSKEFQRKLYKIIREMKSSQILATEADEKEEETGSFANSEENSPEFRRRSLKSQQKKGKFSSKN